MTTTDQKENIPPFPLKDIFEKIFFDIGNPSLEISSTRFCNDLINGLACHCIICERHMSKARELINFMNSQIIECRERNRFLQYKPTSALVHHIVAIYDECLKCGALNN